MRIVFTGGGTGGHLYPIIAVAREVKRIAEEERILDLELYYFGPEAVAPQIMAAEGIVFSRVIAGKIRRYFAWRNVLDVFKVSLGILQALWNMFMVMPDVVLAKGGYGSFPTLLAARLYRIPVMVHSSDAVPGRVEEWAGRWARRVAISFPPAAAHFPPATVAITGVPIRTHLLGSSRERAQEILGIYAGRPVIYVTGGSQGAQAVNRAVIPVLPALLERYEVIHQDGEKNFEDVRLETEALLEGEAKKWYHPAPFLDEEHVSAAYALADLVVSRSGATSLYEIAAWAKPAIVIPLKNSAQDHQRANAYQYARDGAALVIEEDNLTSSVLAHEIRTLLDDPGRLARMAEAAKAFSRPDAAALIAKELLTLGLHEPLRS